MNQGLPPLGSSGSSSSGSGSGAPGMSPSSGSSGMGMNALNDSKPKIQAFDQRMGAGTARSEDSWKRTPNASGQGASHVKSFHCKLNTESLEYMDRQINEWLDAHPGFEVKFVNCSVGEWQGKVKEPNFIVQVWV